MADKFGMMSQAYFKGKRELLEWISDVLDMDVPKVEKLASGAHYCQLLDACHPGSIKMSKVNFAARTEEAYVANWKLIQIAFEKKGIQKLIPVLRLVKARFQDNLEFLQWFHQYFQTTYRDTGAYDPQARRRKCKGINTIKSRSGGGAGSHSKPARPNYGAKRTRAADAGASRRQTSSTSSTQQRQVPNPVNQELEKRTKELMAEKAVVERELARISKTAQLIENERDFYFKILLKVETMCKESPTPDHPCIKKIIQVLYTPSEDQSPRPAADAPSNEAGTAPSGEKGTMEVAAAQAATGAKQAEADKENDAGASAMPVDEVNPNSEPPVIDPSLEASIDFGKGEPLVDLDHDTSMAGTF